MQQGITFEPIRHTPVLHPWHFVAAFLLFAALVLFAVRRSRNQAKEPKSLNLNGK